MVGFSCYFCILVILAAVCILVILAAVCILVILAAVCILVILAAVCILVILAAVWYNLKVLLFTDWMMLLFKCLWAVGGIIEKCFL